MLNGFADIRLSTVNPAHTPSPQSQLRGSERVAPTHGSTPLHL